MGSICFFGGIVLICAAHMIRILRWELLIAVYEKPDRRSLVWSLVYGYLMNILVPLKLGEAVRAWVAGKRMKNGKALGFSTVIADRYLDIVMVGLIFFLFFLFGIGKESIRGTIVLYAVTAVLLLLFLGTAFAFRGFTKKIIMKIAGIFNDAVEAAILKTVWALIGNFKDIFSKIGKGRMLLYTFAMWGCYLGSYCLFAQFLQELHEGTSWSDLFIMLFTQNGLQKSTAAMILDNGYTGVDLIYWAVYLILPLLLLFAVSMGMKSRQPEEASGEAYLRLLPQLDSNERLIFLEYYFSDQNREYISNYLKVNQGISIIRNYSAGSNATTLLCTDGKNTFFRKYAFGEDGEKLYQQICWLEKQKDCLALPVILKKEKTELYCFYDMKYSSSAVGMFEYVHSVPIEQAWQLLRKVLESLESSIYQTEKRTADRDLIHRYVESKVRRNLEIIKSEKKIRSLQQYDTIVINGTAYRNLSYYEKFLQEEYLQKVFCNASCAVIHGDLTIENIICTRNEKGEDDFYLIDPNTGNILESPDLDYAKLLQSIHGGYEFFMMAKDVSVQDNRIHFLFTKSLVYTSLHEKLKEYMLRQFGAERMRSIYFHEIIHWLRLMPYKIEKDSKRALLFYAGMLMVMNDVIEMYEDGEIKSDNES